MNLEGKVSAPSSKTLITDLKLVENVVLLGTVSERRVFEGLEAAHLFVLASHREPLGVAIMEALSCETRSLRQTLEECRNSLTIESMDTSFLRKFRRNWRMRSNILRKSLSGKAILRIWATKVEQSFNSEMSAQELKRLLEYVK